MNDALVNEHFRRADLVAEVAAHNGAVIIARRRGDWSTPYRNAITEIEAQSATDLDRQIRAASDEEIEAMVTQSKLEGQP